MPLHQRCPPRTPVLLEGPFTTAQGLAAGVTYKQLRGPAYEAVHPRRGVWVRARTPRDLGFWLAADRLILPPDAALSHATGLVMYGVPLATTGPRHWSTATSGRTRLAVRLHRVNCLGMTTVVRGVRVLSPMDCFVGAASEMSLLNMIQVGDWLLTHEHISLAQVRACASTRSAFRIRSAAEWMRIGAESFRETSTRVILRLSGLPQPEVNMDIVDAAGQFVARGDLPFPRWKLLVEYDGWYHERSAEQRQRDLLRREALERLGWRHVVLTSQDVAHPDRLVGRVWQMLTVCGYRGPAPLFDQVRWERFLAAPQRKR
ncbi:hypothetical protein [Rudaeicoccus suwonensis]|uniref:hypothetical protein n=1 Tax=Rudaeicoccus suwonensis TaxID=657409 RepID=UPI00119F8F1D|nr:hypothetical protein [Rudaeicoccus suwonensis]